MATDLPIAGGRGGTPAGPGPADLALPADARRALADVLEAGEVVSGRVVQALGDDQYLFSLRGRTLIAASQLPLTPDSVVRIQVLAAAGDQLSLRLVGGTPGDQAQVSDASARLQALGLPADQVGALALAAFEDAGAPLARSPLLAAVASLAQAAASQAGGAASASSPPQLAAALAALARDGLPATPATIALALRAVDPALPNPAAALAQLQEAVGNAPSPEPAPTDQQPAPPAASTPAAPAPGGTAPPPAAVPGSPVASPMPAVPAAAGISAGPPTLATPPSPPAVPAATMPAAVGAAAVQAAVPASPPAAAAQIPVGSMSSSAPAGSAAPAVPGAAVTVAAGPAGAESAAGGPPAASGGSASPAASAPPSPSQPGTVRGDLALRAVLDLRLPDPGVAGASAAAAALALAGIRSAASAQPGARPRAESAPPTLVKQLAAASEAARADPAGPERPALPPGMGEALVRAVREGAAESVVKPESLADYDLVVGLPLQDQGRPTPARLAVAERRTAAGNATYLRVDAELSHLGPVSVRLSGVDGGPLAITLLADGGGGQALADELPALADSLQRLGIVAGLRVASLDEDATHG